jgi:hypothetical protein
MPVTTRWTPNETDHAIVVSHINMVKAAIGVCQTGIAERSTGFVQTIF